MAPQMDGLLSSWAAVVVVVVADVAVVGDDGDAVCRVSAGLRNRRR